LTVEQSKELAEKHHIYMVHGGGRISVAGLNTSNVAIVAKAFDAVTRNSSF
jgi:Aspartate/tyrosine/aromatic aminotransferase